MEQLYITPGRDIDELVFDEYRETEAISLDRFALDHLIADFFLLY